MHDRFDAQLREHLIETADTGPATGQLAGVLQAVYGTAQKHPLAARLTWFPGRVGPVSSRTLRLGLVVAALVATLAAALLYVGNPARTTVFEGTWTSTDRGDGSTQTLVVGRGSNPTVRFVDDYATGRACRDDKVKVFTAEGDGTVVPGDRLEVVWPDGGGCGLLALAMTPSYYDYDESTDTITDNDRVTWRRAAGAVAPPTRGPQTPAPQTPEPTLGPDCVDLGHGGTYAARLGPLTVSMTVPSDTPNTWQGRRGDQFYLSGWCEFNTPIIIQANLVTTVYSDACAPASSGLEVTSYAMAVEQLSTQHGHAITAVASAGPTVDGLPAQAFELDFGTATCAGPLALWNGISVTDGQAVAILVDAGDVTLGILVGFHPDPVTGVPNADQRAEAEAIVNSLDVQTDSAPEPTNATAIPECTEWRSDVVYTAHVGTRSVSLTVPARADMPWSGARDRFLLQRAACIAPGMPVIQAAFVDRVYADACRWRAGEVATPTTGEVVTALQGQLGHDTVGPIFAKLGSLDAIRFDVSLPPDFNLGACDPVDEGSPLRYDTVLGDWALIPGGTIRLYVADVGGATLAIAVAYTTAEMTPDDLAQIDPLMETLRVTD